MPRRARVMVCLVAAGLLSIVLVAPLVAAPPPIPMRTEGRAFAAPGLPLPLGTPIRTFVDGVDYSVNATEVQDETGSFVVETEGNSKTNPDVSDTPDELEGPNTGDDVIYAAGDFTTFTGVFVEVESWSPEGKVTRDLTLGSMATTPQPLKIQGLVPQPARGGDQFLFLCNPTSSAVNLGEYYLERNALGNYHGPRLDLTGSIAASSFSRVNLTGDWLAVAGDAVKLVYENPRGPNATAGGLDIVVDRVEYNAARNGTLNWEPGNTILGDAVAPGPGQILHRDSACTDTNDPADFSLAMEPGLPSTNLPPAVTIITPASGQAVPGGTTVTLEWNLTDDVFHPKYLHVWANLTYGNQTVRLVSDGLGTTGATWTSPGTTLTGVVLRVEVQDPFGQRGVASRTFGVTPQSPLALVIAIVIALVLVAFLIFAFLRARRKELGPPPTPPPPPMPPTMSAVPPSVPAAPAESREREARKACPRCHTLVKAEDATCFFCSYRFPDETRLRP